LYPIALFLPHFAVFYHISSFIQLSKRYYLTKIGNLTTIFLFI
jgi:hypothetical protein